MINAENNENNKEINRLKTSLDSNQLNPSIDYVSLPYKQKFENAITTNGVTVTKDNDINGVSKVTIKFKREEDMLLICLSAFVHDYIHDYNLGTMHSRVINKNTELFKSLNIKSGLQYFKTFAYSYGGGPRDIRMYNDREYTDTSKGQKEGIFNFNFDNNEIGNTANKLIGGEQIPEGPFNLKKDFVTDAKSDENIDEDIIDKEAKGLEENNVQQAVVEPLVNVVEPLVNVIEPLVNIIQPLVNGLTETMLTKIYEKYENDADIISLHSSLNTFIVTYLGCRIREHNPLFSDIIKNVSPVNVKNASSLNDILNSLDYIIYSFLIGSVDDTTMLGYADLFVLLKCAFCHIVEKNNNNLEINNFDLLVSSDVINQFIMNYIAYLFCENVDEIVHYFPVFSSDNVNNLENEIIQEGGLDEEPFEIEVVSRKKRTKKIKVPVPKYEVPTEEPEYTYIIEPVEGYWSPNNKMYFNVAEYIFIMHNNLLTTISRGMFIKLGIWQKLFGENYTFGNEQMNMITLDNLKTIYPFDENKNNELLCLQILILKRMLLEMNPVYTLSFGAKIDDDLKDYLDAFYNEYYLDKTKKAEPSTNFPEEVYNPTIEGPNATMNNLSDFDVCDEYCDDNIELEEFAGEDMGSVHSEGGGQILTKTRTTNNVDPGDIEMVKREDNIPALEEVPEKQEEEEVPESVDFEQINKEKENSEEGSESFDLVEEEKEEEVPESKYVNVSSPTNKEVSFNGQVLLPILFNKLKKAYQNNIYTIKNLQDSKIPSTTHNGQQINNLYDLLKANVTLISKDGSFKIPAPKYKFIINNAANIAANINGMRLFYSKKSLDEIAKIIETVENDNSLTLEKIDDEYTETLQGLDEVKDKLVQLEQNKRMASQGDAMLSLEEYKEIEDLRKEYKNMERQLLIPLENKYFLLNQKLTNDTFYKDFVANYKKWFLDAQPFFGLYRSINHGVFCPTTSMMDAMDNCSLKYEASETKEVGTSNYEVLYESEDKNRSISYGGVVLNYNKSFPDNKTRLCALIDFKLKCKLDSGEDEDIANVSTADIAVVDSNDLKARVAYVGVVNKMKEIYDNYYGTGPSDERDLSKMWNAVQYNELELGGRKNFNELLSATALKTMGDFLQECQACFKWGGYISNLNSVPESIKDLIKSQGIEPIYRSVSNNNSIIPYDNDGNALRLGIQGDRPSGFRSIYMLLNGTEGVNEQSITGYMYTSATQNPSRTLLVARNEGTLNSNGLPGSVIYVTRELQRPDRLAFLSSLKYLKMATKLRATLAGVNAVRQIVNPVIHWSKEGDKPLESIPRGIKQEPLKNIAYDELLDYENSETMKKIIGNNLLEQSTTEEDLQKQIQDKEELKVKVEKERSEKLQTNAQMEKEIQNKLNDFLEKHPTLDEDINTVDLDIQNITNEWQQSEQYKNLETKIEEYSKAGRNEKEKKLLYTDFLSINNLIRTTNLIINDSKILENKPTELLTRKEKALISSLHQKEEELVSLKEKLGQNIVGKLEQDLEQTKPSELTKKESELQNLNLLVLERDGLKRSLKSIQQSSSSLVKTGKTSGGKKEIKKIYTKRNNKIHNKLTKKHKRVRFHKSTKKMYA